MSGDNVLFKNLYLFGMKKVSRHAHKTGAWYMYPLGVLFTVSDEHLYPFYMEIPLGLYCGTDEKVFPKMNKNRSRAYQPLF